MSDVPLFMLVFAEKRHDCAWQTRQVWTFNVASIMILVHTSTVVHSMIRSMRRPLLVLASIITWLGVFDQGHQGLCVTRHVSKGRCFKMFQASPKIMFRFGTRITELNALGILFTLFGAFWYRYENEMVEKNGHSTKRGVLHTRPWEIWLLYRGSRNLFAVLVNFCWFRVPLFWEDAHDCHNCRKTICNHLQTNTILYASDVPFGPWHGHGSYFHSSF